MTAKLMFMAAGIGLVLASAGLDAQVRPRPGSGDPHLQTIDYHDDQVAQIEVAPGYQVAIELAPDERIVNVAIGDGAAWQASVNSAGNRLFVKLAQGSGATNMTVITNVRDYAFELVPLSGPSSEMPYTVQFRYPKPIASPMTAATGVEGRYHLSGARTLRPSAVSDDGARTYIQWPADAALPAIYALEKGGREVLLNGNMRDDIYVIDSVPGTLLFRIDNETARADHRTVTETPR